MTKTALIINGTVRVNGNTDILVEKIVLVEIKALTALTDEHVAQVLTYLKVTNLQVGLLFNFGEKSLAVRRLINAHHDPRPIAPPLCPQAKTAIQSEAPSSKMTIHRTSLLGRPLPPGTAQKNDCARVVLLHVTDAHPPDLASADLSRRPLCTIHATPDHEGRSP